jgi:hypothetical protein
MVAGFYYWLHPNLALPLFYLILDPDVSLSNRRSACEAQEKPHDRTADHD